MQARWPTFHVSQIFTCIHPGDDNLPAAVAAAEGGTVVSRGAVLLPSLTRLDLNDNILHDLDDLKVQQACVCAGSSSLLRGKLGVTNIQ